MIIYKFPYRIGPKGTMTIPSQSGTLTYNTLSQSPTWNNYDSTKMTLSGDTSGTNAGTYTAIFTLDSHYEWSDGTTGAKSVSWAIGKAPGNVTLSKDSVNLTRSNPTDTVTYSNNTGTVSVTSADPTVATASVSGSTITITQAGGGGGGEYISDKIDRITTYGGTTVTPPLSIDTPPSATAFFIYLKQPASSEDTLTIHSSDASKVALTNMGDYSDTGITYAYPEGYFRIDLIARVNSGSATITLTYKGEDIAIVTATIQN